MQVVIPKERIAENIAEMFENLDVKENRKAIFKHYKSIDESHLYPILGDFDVTKRAIRRLHEFERKEEMLLSGVELCYWLEDEITKIVNKEY